MPSPARRRRSLGARRFEALLKEVAALPVETAGEADATDDPIRLIREAEARLRDQPELRRRAPDGTVTYSDPVLAVAHYYARVAAEEGATAGPPGSELRDGSILRWIVVGVRSLFSRSKKELMDLAARVPTRTLRLDKEVARLGVVGDAGYQGKPQDQVLFLIREVHARKPFDLVIHLGDVYFAGSERDFFRHLLVPFDTLGIRLVTLCGNHDIYCGTAGYIGAMQLLQQPGRYFLVETPHWRIACLDTASAAGDAKIPVDGVLDPTQLEWLTRLLVDTDRRPLLLMSHHFILSGWDKPSAKLDQQIGRLIKDRVFAWYWGHEHRSACYGRGERGYYGACVGNGAFLERWSQPDPGRPVPEWYAQTRCRCLGAKKPNDWPHGFLELELSAGEVRETWHLEGGETHLRLLS